MKLTSLLACTALVFSLASPLLADEAASTPPPLSLDECVAIAMQNQVDVLVGENNVISAQERVTQAKSAYYPQASLQYSNTLLDSGLGSVRTNNGTSLSVTQNFYDGGLRETRIKGSKAGVEQSGYALTRTKQTVVFSVTRDYYDYLRAQQLAKVEDTQVKYLEEQLALVQTRVEVGDAAPVDALPIQAQLANARVDRLQAQNAVRTAAIQLQQTMGVKPSPTFAIQEQNLPAVAALNEDAYYVKLALAHRPEVGQTQAGVKAAEADVKTAKISLAPRPVISGAFDQPIASGDEHAMTITGGIVFDLFNGGANRAAYKEAKAGLDTAKVRSTQISKDIEADVQNAYLNVQNALERMTASELSLKSAQQNFETQQARYAQGIAIPLDLLNAQVEIANAQSNAVRARYDYYTYLAQLAYATGLPQGELHEAK